jgi:hypothetical protein
MRRRLVAVVVASALAAGCEHPFEPFQEDEDALFSMFGYLDLNADTQWVRVMPVRTNLLLEPEPIDAVVTLEHVGSGQLATLNDSLFRFVDPRLEGVAYAHNFWTTETLEPGATYRLRAARPDGAASTAFVVMPADPELTILQDRTYGRSGIFAFLQVRAEKVLFVEMLYAAVSLSIGGPATVPIREYWTFSTDVPGTHGIAMRVDTSAVRRKGFSAVGRQEIRLVVGRSDWPYHPGLSDLAVTLPGAALSNVENGLGFVGGVATWTIPFDRCVVIEARPDPEQSCATVFDAQSASIAGRVIRAPCGDPHPLASISLTERFAGGGAVTRTWLTGWGGQFRFEGIEPGADLLLEVGFGNPAVDLPALSPGERHTVEDISVSGRC